VRALRIIIAVVLAAVVALAADPAAAKGPVGATIDGQGLHASIDGVELGKLPALTGLYFAMWTDPAMPLPDEAPTTDLGPAWVITWDMGTYAEGAASESDAPNLVRQTVYPYAADGPIIHTEPGQPFYEDETVGGWYTAPPSLTSMLTTFGVPAQDAVASTPAGDGDERAELAGSTRASDAATSDGSSGSSTDWAAGAVASVAGAVASMVLVAAVAAVTARRRRHTSG
jgi:hypothetical protein